jgi:hypothetical protein
LKRVRKIALALPAVEEGRSWGTPAFKLRGKMIACVPTNKAAEPDSLVVMIDFPQRDELLAAEPDVYYLKEHYVNYPCLLVRLKKVHPDALRDLIRMAWQYIDGKSTRKRPAGRTRRRTAVRAMVLIAAAIAVPIRAQTSPTADAIAREVVIGQAYISRNVYVAGFVDDEPRPWPRRIIGMPLDANRTGRIAADFFRIVAQDSEEHYWFPQREADTFEDDIFSTIDRMAIADRNLARYRASAVVDRPLAFFAWNDRLDLVDLSHRSGEMRPASASEREQIAADRKAIQKDGRCTTEPQFLDDAKIILTARIANTARSIRLSKYSTPGCLGHFADIYVLDVIDPGGEPRRFEFRHYQGLL